MTKQEAAEYLEVSVRALERYVQQGKISVKYEKGKTRSTANFDEAELAAFKQELNQPSYKPAVESRQNATSTTTDTESRQNATQPQLEVDKLAHYSTGEIAEFGEIGDVAQMASIIEKLIELLSKNQTPSLTVGEKILLTLSEAQDLTGLSREFLRAAINEGTLKAKLIGKSWRLKRADLDEYVKGLF